jgi:hypothetical protein
VTEGLLSPPKGNEKLFSSGGTPSRAEESMVLITSRYFSMDADFPAIITRMWLPSASGSLATMRFISTLCVFPRISASAEKE